MPYNALQDVRYTDEDLRSDAELWDAVEQYALAYRGDWQPMVKARNAVAVGATTVAVMRMVANVMRQDAQGAQYLPSRERLRFPTSEERIVSEHKAHRVVASTVVKEPLNWFKLNGDWHYKYIYSTFVTAQVYHILDQSKSVILYQRFDIQQRPVPWERRFTLQPVALCGWARHTDGRYQKSEAGWGLSNGTVNLVSSEGVPLGESPLENYLRPCRSCVRLEESRA